MNKRIFLVSILLLLVLGGRFFPLNISNWLALSDEPRKADVIICLNGNPDRMPKAVELFRQGYADIILVTFPSTRNEALKYGVPGMAVVSLNGGYNSTYEEALHAVRFMKQENLHSAIIVSDPYHMYRAKWTYGYLANAEAIELTYIAS